MDQDTIVARVTSRGVQVILACISGGLADYENPALYSPEAKRDHTPSVAATCRNCHIVARAKRAAVEAPELVQIKKKRTRLTFVFGDKTEIWFKKLDDRGWPSHRPSQQSLEFIEPHLVQALLNIELPAESERWIAGYRPSVAAGTAFEILITGPETNGNRWEVPLSDKEVRELLAQPAKAPAASEVIKKRVRVRREAKRKDATGDAEA